ncbi:MAG: ammonium transporter [Cyanobacteria bacterium P01_C01_bin.89]
MEQVLINRLWIIGCSILVFLMQAGFLCLEAGATRRKNSINVALKNITDFAVSVLLFWVVGYGLMFGATANGWWTSWAQWPFDLDTNQMIFFLFQAVFCGTAVTIVSGAIAERMHFYAYVALSAVISGLIYPVFGHWSWNGLQGGTADGWLNSLGFVDFAGSMVVHGLGGAVALVVLLIVGPRRDRFRKNLPPQSVNGSDPPRTILGALILWLGWLGFNGGSTLALNDSVPQILINTIVGGASGLLFPLLLTAIQRKPAKVEWLTNGCLAGLVSVTAPCYVITPTDAIVIGAIGGLVMLGFDYVLLRYRIDDAVGSVPVHLGGGIWGTLAVALFGDPDLIGTGLNSFTQFGVQLLGVGASLLWVSTTTIATLWTLSRFMPLRVSRREELLGLNMVEHGARSDLVELFDVMTTHKKTGDLSLRVPAEPFTEVGQLALRYNQLIASLEAATARTQAIVDTASEAILSVSPGSRMIKTASAVALEMFRCDEGDLIGTSVVDLFALEKLSLDNLRAENGSSPEMSSASPLSAAPTEGALSSETLPQLLTAEAPIHDPQPQDEQEIFWDNVKAWIKEGTRIELVGRRRDGEYFPMELRAALCQEGRQTTFIFILSDVLKERTLRRTALEMHTRNERLKEALDQLRHSQSQLVQSEKISALGRMVAGISHELNNPISFINGNISHLRSYTDDLLSLIALYQEHLPESSPQIDAAIDTIDFPFIQKDMPNLLQSITNGSERIRAIVNSLKTFSRLDESSLKEADIHEALDSTLLLTEYLLKANKVQVVRNYCDLPLVECFIGDLTQVFFNIISNAVEALAGMKGARSPLILTISTDYEATKANPNVVIRIQDNGIGISSGNLGRIFDPFYTTKEVGEGTGLGLAVSYQVVVDEHQGQLTVDSVPGKSTTFTIKIPSRQGKPKTRPIHR